MGSNNGNDIRVSEVDVEEEEDEEVAEVENIDLSIAMESLCRRNI